MRMSPGASLTQARGCEGCPLGSWFSDGLAESQAHKVFKQLGCKRIFLVGSMRGNSQD